MLEKCSKKERWSGVEDMISRWLGERQTVIVQYCALSGVHSQAPESESLQNRLDAFCQLLVDYVSAGHFEIYYELMKEAESFNDGTIDLIKKVVPLIHVTTEDALDFNEFCAQKISSEQEKQLPEKLSRLGETLAARFELEDQLISGIHRAHEEHVA